ncbi:MAG: ABC transporter permease [Gemmatimonadaceae bacterium]
MSLFSDLMERLRALAGREHAEHDLQEELEFHLERDVRERVKQGAAPDAARREARLALGNIELRKEEVRDASGVRPLRELVADLRFAARGLRRNPGYTATALLVLSLGLGATTAVITVMNAVVFAPLPYPDPERLIRVMADGPGGRRGISTAEVYAMREQQRSFVALAAAERSEAALSGIGTPERISVARVDGGFFATIGVPIASGRAIDRSDEGIGAPPVVVVTRALAERLPGGASAALGQALSLDGVSHTVIGVLAAGREELGGLRAAAWSALKLPPPTRRGPFWLRVVARLQPGTTPAAANRDLSAIARRLLPQFSDYHDSTTTLIAVPLRDTIIGRASQQVPLFAGAVALVLLLAITNVATLALVRASARVPEVAVRIMLGAGRGRIVRLFLTESVLLTLVAGVMGIGVAALGLKLAVTQLSDLPRIHDVAFNLQGVLLALGISIVAGILVSLSPLATLANVGSGRLQADSRRTGSGRQTGMLRSALVTAEFALTLPLLVGAGLLLNSFARLQRVDPGFSLNGLVSIGVSLPSARYAEPEAIARFQRQAEQRLTEAFGADHAGLASDIPPDNSGNTDNFNLVDHPVPVGASEPGSPWYYVTSGYFSALGMRLLSGRMFTDADSGNASPVVVVSRSWAQRFFPGEDPVGRRLIQGGCTDCERTTIVGVVPDIRVLGPAGTMEAIYSPMAQSGSRTFNLVVRGPAATGTTLGLMRDLVRKLDPELPLDESTFVDRFDTSLVDPRRWASVLTAFAMAGMALSALGVFGLMSYVVRQRRREIGVRMALGARPTEITRLVVVRGMRYALVGSAIGLVVALLAANRLQDLLFDVGPRDMRTIAGVAFLLLGSALLASWLPGRRAGKIKPVEAIAAE